jgi:hypothetical protein
MAIYDSERQIGDAGDSLTDIDDILDLTLKSRRRLQKLQAPYKGRSL